VQDGFAHGAHSKPWDGNFNDYLIAFWKNQYDNRSMARLRSEQTLLVKDKMIARLKGGFHPASGNAGNTIFLMDWRAWCRIS